MKRFLYPDKAQWTGICTRPYADNEALLQRVRVILNEVRLEGDKALLRMAQQFDGVLLQELWAEQEALANAEKLLSPELATAIQHAAANISRFHQEQLREEPAVEIQPGVHCWRKSLPIERVGLYVPGGSAPLFSTVLMLGIPARLAGCSEIVLATPPQANGSIHPAILFAAQLCGITRVLKAGGAQAIAALGYGTESVPRVDKLYGPGNQYVTAAKQLLQQEGVAIDMPAGPSELAILADASAIPEFVAADLLSQAEHGSDSQLLLVCSDSEVLEAVLASLNKQLALLPRRHQAEGALLGSRAVLVDDLKTGMELINAYAAEHLILHGAEAGQMAQLVRHAGSVFIGSWSPESVGDYASGTNHTLPTNGFARNYSGVSVDSFVRKVTFQQLTPEGLEGLASTVMTMAAAEGLAAHAAAVQVRLDYLAHQPASR